MKKKVNLKEVAVAFGMTITKFAEFLGYSKQALYQLNDGTNGICTSRYYSALRLLKFQSDKMYEDALEKAERDKATREALIQQMCDNVSAIGVIERVE